MLVQEKTCCQKHTLAVMVKMVVFKMIATKNTVSLKLQKKPHKLKFLSQIDNGTV